jgi:polyhydroxybutyrate depolymerase
MLAQRAAVLALLVGGCSSGGCSGGPPPDRSEGSSDTTSGPASGTTTSITTTPSTADAGGSSESTTGASADGETGVDTSTGSSETGTEPPAGSPGCTAKTSLAEGEQQFMLDGLDRRYILRLPQNYSTDHPWPLIFALHGNGGDPSYWDGMGGDRDIRTAFANDAIIVIPEAIGNAWRDYEAPPESWPAGIELELGYFDSIYQTAREQLCVDEGNVFAMGFSGGGSFSGVLGCRRDYIRAIAVGGSVIYFDPAECVSTPAAWITIGDKELTAGREEFRDFFRMLAGCAETSTPGAPDGCVNYDGCGATTPVTFCSHPAGHVWPAIGTDATKAFFESFYAAG